MFVDYTVSYVDKVHEIFTVKQIERNHTASSNGLTIGLTEHKIAINN